MSELIDNLRMKKDALKHLILQLHEGTAPEAVRAQVARLMGEVPYGLVVEVEQELIESGDLPIEEVQRLCDVHSQALRGQIDLSQTKEPPAGHPIDVFRRENRALEEAARSLSGIFQDLRALPAGAPAAHLAARLAEGFRRLLEVDRHYRRKENLLFPYLEKRGISGPSQVMWGKDDEARELLRAAVEAAEAGGSGDAESLRAALPLLFEPAAAAVEEMIFKEEQILFPMIVAGRGAFATGPIQMMEMEHDEHGANLARTRAMTGDFTAPPEACPTWQALYLRLRELEGDLMDHIALENNILFPRALCE